MLGRSEFALRQGFAAQNACGGALAPADETREAACNASRFCFGIPDRELKCSGEVNSPSAKVLLRKTLVRRKSVVFCFGRPNRYGTSELGVLFFIRTFPVND